MYYYGKDILKTLVIFLLNISSKINLYILLISCYTIYIFKSLEIKVLIGTYLMFQI